MSIWQEQLLKLKNQHATIDYLDDDGRGDDEAEKCIEGTDKGLSKE